MPKSVSIPTRFVAAVLATLVLGVALIASAPASATVRLALTNPSQNCDRHQVNYLHVTIRHLNRCRRLEGLGPIHRPSNYRRLTAAEKLFVLMNLARVNRGLRPIVGLSQPLDRLAKRAAWAQTDPAFPSHGFQGGGSLWAFAFSVPGTELQWMYDDGWGPSGTNSACSSATATGCWMHRDIILMRSQRRLVAGGAVRRVPMGNMPAAHSFAFEILAGYSTRHLVFRWRTELAYFKVRPKVERLRRR